MLTFQLNGESAQYSEYAAAKRCGGRCEAFLSQRKRFVDPAYCRMSTYRLDRLLALRSVVLAGASPREGSLGFHIHDDSNDADTCVAGISVVKSADAGQRDTEV